MLAKPVKHASTMDSETLLKPISEESPCGVDVAYDPKFLELDTLIAGKPETQFSAGEEPDWKNVRVACLEIFARSKHLRVATLLCVALVKLEGAPGLREGLTLLKGLLENYWPDFFPKLDPEEQNDPLERVNMISSLSTPLGTYGDPMRFLQRLREMPLANSPQMGRFGMADLAGDKVAGGVEGQPPAASPAQVAAALRDTAPAELEATYAAIAESIALARGMDDFLTQTIGAGHAPDMDPLLGVLAEIEKGLAPYVPGLAGDVSASSDEPRAAGGTEGGNTSGAIESRRDVLRALDRICEYYSRSESSSPVPLLLQRARRLVDMDFVQIVNDLAPEALGQISVVTGYRGSTGDATPPPIDESV